MNEIKHANNQSNTEKSVQILHSAQKLHSFNKKQKVYTKKKEPTIGVLDNLPPSLFPPSLFSQQQMNYILRIFQAYKHQMSEHYKLRNSVIPTGSYYYLIFEYMMRGTFIRMYKKGLNRDKDLYYDDLRILLLVSFFTKMKPDHRFTRKELIILFRRLHPGHRCHVSNRIQKLSDLGYIRMIMLRKGARHYVVGEKGLIFLRSYGIRLGQIINAFTQPSIEELCNIPVLPSGHPLPSTE